MEEAEVERERELRSRLSRQAAAHDEHVKDVLRVQQHELQTAFDVRLAGLVDRERVALQQKVAGWTGRMQGVDKALAGSSAFHFCVFAGLSAAALCLSFRAATPATFVVIPVMFQAVQFCRDQEISLVDAV